MVGRRKSPRIMFCDCFPSFSLIYYERFRFNKLNHKLEFRKKIRKHIGQPTENTI